MKLRAALALVLGLAAARGRAQAFDVEPAVAGMRAQIRAGLAAAIPPDPMTPDQVRARVEALLAGSVPRGYVAKAFADPRTKVLDGIAEKFGHPAEALPYEKYRLLFATEANVAAGAKFAADHKELLEQVRARYGVDGALLTALVCVETRYGANTGSIPVFDDLYTIALKVKPMSDWAARELAAFVKTCWKQGVDPHVPLGSYAGATGYVQFEPSTVALDGVDFDGDGSVDLNAWPDALASAANYLARSGYDASAPFTPESKIGRSIRAYNHSDNYVRVVLELRGLISARAGTL